MHILREHFFSITIISLCVLTAAASWYRFGYLDDYLVTFEIDCDPNTHSCHIGCDDDECVTMYPYAYMERHAVELQQSCGPDILECDEVATCPDGVHCEILYCDSSTEECYQSDFEDV